MTFESIYQEYWDKIYRLCLAYLNDRDLAKDLAQESFIIVWQQLPSFRQESSIGTWIYRIASNNCLKQIERDKRMPKTELPEQIEMPQIEDQQHEIQLLYRFISELPEIERIIISLDLEGIKQNEIAHIVGLSEGNTRVKIHRIKEKLTQKFKSYGKQGI